MRIGSPSLEWVLVAANIGVLTCLAAVHVTQDQVAHGPAVHVVDQRPGPPVLVVVSAGSPADVGVGRSAAEALGGALLVIPAEGIGEVMRQELSELSPGRALILGGAAAVAEGTAQELARFTRTPVTRVAGADRFETAAKVAMSQFLAPVAMLRVVSGDAVAALPHEADLVADAPLLLVEADRIPAAAAAALRLLRPQGIEVSGGAAEVSDAVLRQLEVFTTGDVVRLSDLP